MADLTGSVAVITGGSKGIGEAIARRLAADGADLVLAARTQADLSAAADSIGTETGRRVETVAVDLRTSEGAERLHSEATSAFDSIDILVNNAGATKPGPFLELSDEDWLDGFALKFHGAVRLSRLFWPDLVSSHGTVVNVVGGLARTPTPDITIAGGTGSARRRQRECRPPRPDRDGPDGHDPGLAGRGRGRQPGGVPARTGREAGNPAAG
jgi:3-oxoacyl-[acyl-carrier protein] reductase